MKLFTRLRKLINTLFDDKEHVDIYRGMTITRAVEIKAILDPIPSEKFMKHSLGSCYDNSSCALGHINRAISPKGPLDFYGDGYGARDLTIKFLKEVHNEYASITNVNDSDWVNGYHELTPKERVMHMVEEMIKRGY